MTALPTTSGEDTLDEPVSPVAMGTLLAGKYRLERVLGTGGMGVVVAATHEFLRQPVAIKFLKPDRQDDTSVGRLLREARIAAQLESPHIVRVHDADTTDDGIPYLVMERLEGHSLADELARAGALPIDVAVRYVLDVLSALTEAHARGIVHRDLKPTNVFLARDANGETTLRVLDFGISKLPPDTSEGDATLTGDGAVLGSPRYMSPEQIRNPRQVDHRSDLWSVGIVLYELLTGRRAIAGDGVGEILARIREEDLPPIRRLRGDVPAGLEAVLERCLRREPERRVASAMELAAALAPYATAAGVAAARRRRLWPVLAVAAATVALGATAVVGAGLANARSEPRSTPMVAHAEPPSALAERAPDPGPMMAYPATPPTAPASAGPPTPPAGTAPAERPPARRAVMPARPSPASHAVAPAVSVPVTQSKLLRTRD